MSKHLTKKRDFSPSETVIKIPKDGNCFFHCLKSVLPTKNILEIRNDLADFIMANRGKYQEFETDKTVFETFKLTFLHETKKQSHEFMKIFLKIEGRSDDDAPQLLLGTSNIYVKIHRKRAQIGNVWLNMESIMDS